MWSKSNFFKLITHSIFVLLFGFAYVQPVFALTGSCTFTALWADALDGANLEGDIVNVGREYKAVAKDFKDCSSSYYVTLEVLDPSGKKVGASNTTLTRTEFSLSGKFAAPGKYTFKAQVLNGSTVVASKSPSPLTVTGTATSGNTTGNTTGGNNTNKGSSTTTSNSTPDAGQPQGKTGSGTGAFVQCGNQDGGKPGDGCQIRDLFSTVARIINYLFAGAGVIAVGGVVFGGFKMVTSAGNEHGVTAGKTAIKNSLIGLAIVLLAILVVQSVLRLLQYKGDPDQIITDPQGYFQSGGGQ